MDKNIKEKIYNYRKKTTNTSLNQTQYIAPAGPTGSEGAGGENGLSAYDIAVENGFIGTEQDWLNSLVGPTGTTGTTRTIIPYNVNHIELIYDVYNDEIRQGYITPGFRNDIETNDFEPGPAPDIFNIWGDDLEQIVAFSVPYDAVITKISGEYLGGGELDGYYFYVNYCLYVAEQNSTLFHLVPDSMLRLEPMFNANTPFFNSNGQKTFSHFVPAGSKIAFFAYLIPAFPNSESNSATGDIMASITLESLE